MSPVLFTLEMDIQVSDVAIDHEANIAFVKSEEVIDGTNFYVFHFDQNEVKSEFT